MSYVCGPRSPCRPHSNPDLSGGDHGHCWHAFTRARLAWLYGEDAIPERTARANRDGAAWSALGSAPPPPGRAPQ